MPQLWSELKYQEGAIYTDILPWICRRRIMLARTMQITVSSRQFRISLLSGLRGPVNGIVDDDPLCPPFIRRSPPQYIRNKIRGTKSPWLELAHLWMYFGYYDRGNVNFERTRETCWFSDIGSCEISDCCDLWNMYGENIARFILELFLAALPCFIPCYLVLFFVLLALFTITAVLENVHTISSSCCFSIQCSA